MATDILREAGLTGNAQGSGTVVLDSLEVTYMSTQPGTIVKKGTVIYLRCFETKQANAADKPKLNDDTMNKMQKLSLSIDEATMFQDGFHYEFPGPENSQRTEFSDFTKGIFGAFHYRKVLTEDEKLNIGHGRNLYDENMNEISGEYTGLLQMVISQCNFRKVLHLEHIYELYQVIDG